jgi:hypothetical protein
MEYYAFGIIALAGVVLVISAASTTNERRIRVIEHRLSLLLHHFGIDPNSNIPPSEEVRQLAADPRKMLEAIELYRKETGSDLKASVAVVKALHSSSDTA